MTKILEDQFSSSSGLRAVQSLTFIHLCSVFKRTFSLNDLFNFGRFGRGPTATPSTVSLLVRLSFGLLAFDIVCDSMRLVNLIK